MKSSAILLALLASGTIHAEMAMNLEKALGANEIKVTSTETHTGSCGGSAVIVTGVRSLEDTFFTGDADDVRVIVRRSPEKSLTLTASDSVISDQNGIACISVKNKKLLLVWGKCGGAACHDNEYMVIDPQSLTVVEPRNRNSICSAKCANDALYGFLPKVLLGR